MTANISFPSVTFFSFSGFRYRFRTVISSYFSWKHHDPASEFGVLVSVFTEMLQSVSSAFSKGFFGAFAFDF